MKENEIKLMKNLALEYRLSQKNICKLLRIEPTHENLEFIYNEFLSVIPKGDIDKQKEIKYLFYETSLENKKIELISYQTAAVALQRIIKANSLGNSESIIQILNKTDNDFNSLKRRQKWVSLTKEEILIIAKYRVKHALSKRIMNKLIGINAETLSKNEKNIEGDYWGSKLELLNEYNYLVCNVDKLDKRRKH